MTEDELKADLNFSAIMVISDPACLELNLQIFSDILMSPNGRINPTKLLQSDEKQHVKLYLTNPDITYAEKYAYSRYGAGILLPCLQSLLGLAYNGRQAEFV